MEITWLGHSCFLLRGRGTVLVADPFPETLGYPWRTLQADVVTVSHGHPNHSYLPAIQGTPRYVAQGPGEYEVGGVFITGVRTDHDAQGGKKLGQNTVYRIEMENLVICHLGDLGRPLTSEQAGELGKTDILLIPVGGITTIDGAGAVETIGAISPRVVIPMHYRTEAARPDLDPLDRFLKEMGVKEASSQAKLAITAGNLPQETRVMVLSYPR